MQQGVEGLPEGSLRMNTDAIFVEEFVFLAMMVRNGAGFVKFCATKKARAMLAFMAELLEIDSANELF